MTKPDLVPYPDLLQPLPIPTEVWCSVGIDFITGLPKSEGFEVIMVIVDRLTKFAYFIPLKHPYTAVTVALAFFANIYRNHGLPTFIVSDKDSVFTGKFWKELLRLLGIQLNMSLTFHLQTDGQMERVNQCLKNYL
jgi:transposase InsO family protein